MARQRFARSFAGAGRALLSLRHCCHNGFISRPQRTPTQGDFLQSDQLPALQYKGHIPGLDGLRGLAILLVLVYHGLDGSMPWTSISNWLRWPVMATQYGSSGVQLFFILSGFLITSILLDSRASSGYYKKFYLRRSLRILPAYLLLLTVLKADHVIGWKFVLAALLYIANMAEIVGASNAEYGPLWSLAVEEQFYLLWPFVVRRYSSASLTRIILLWYPIAACLRIAYVLVAPAADMNYKLWFNTETLLAGALIALCLRQNLLRRDNITGVIAILGGLALCLFPFVVYADLHTAAQSPAFRFLLAFRNYPFLFAYSALLLWVLKKNRGPSQKLGSWGRFLTFYGYISYGLYLVHQFLFWKIDALVRGTLLDPYRNLWALPIGFIASTAIATGVAFLSRRYFEDFFLRKKETVAPQETSTPVAV